VIAAGSAPTRVNDTAYDFRADSDFVWLVGAQVEDAVLVVSPDSRTDAVLFLPPPARPGEPGFFSDTLHGELWVGPSAGLAEWREALGIDVRPLDELSDALAGVVDPLGGRRVPSHLGVSHSAELDEVCSDLRRVKDAWEIDQLRSAVDHTADGFAAVAGQIPAATAMREAQRGERWLQGTFDRHARTVGNGPGYATIVGSGAHAPTLHWVRCDGPVHDDQLLLLDMGVEVETCYTADVTRTLPVSGRFNQAQRRVHDLVEASHRAGMAQVRPGNTYSDFHFAALQVIAQGLSDWGLLEVSVDEALSPQGQQHRRWLVCGIGHHLGLDVHDCAHSAWEQYHGAPLEPGMVLTVEPGLYFHAHDLTVPPELRGIGVRLEDDLLVTEDGADVLSDALPIDAPGIEEWTRRQCGLAKLSA
jgi:Xaa-Pro aminopeptidase